MPQSHVSTWLNHLAQQGKDSYGLDTAVRLVTMSPGMQADMVVDANGAEDTLLKSIQSAAKATKAKPRALESAEPAAQTKKTANDNGLKSVFNKMSNSPENIPTKPAVPVKRPPQRSSPK